MNQNKIIAIHYLKQIGEFIIIERNSITGKTSKTHANNLNSKEKAFTQKAKRKFEDSLSIYWIN